ncbi:transcription-repair coupling factor [Dehalococcoides mccartyi]|uniref:Transcription-repair coupling factor n=1 Tax=Dehalococcoides mccartyi TaxID=61435 RepID=A0A2J1DZS0_9CHLR|nr:transcription-repair coupling factor [Dehalococcoides mccartyi]
MDEPASIEQAAFHLDNEAEELRSDRLSQGELPSVYPRPYFSWAEISEMLKTKKRLIMASFGRESESLKLDFASPDNYVGRLSSLYEKLPELKGHAGRVVIVSHQAARLTELLAEEGISTNVQTDILKPPPSASLSLVQGILGAGWSLSGSLHVFTDAELFGFVKQRRLPSKRPVARKGVVLDIKPGEFVVHIDHGVALFSGVSHMNRDGMDKEYLILQYAGGDKLYVPTDQMDRVNRFIGSGDEPPSCTGWVLRNGKGLKKRPVNPRKRLPVSSLRFTPNVNWPAAMLFRQTPSGNRRWKHRSPMWKHLTS